jgi:hypothetical protein
MLDALLTTLGGGSLAFVQELQQSFLYFYTHSWLGAFFYAAGVGLARYKGQGRLH